jgi:secondary thiamine-phosphate synthase enzyme
MISSLNRMTIETNHDCELINITPIVHEVVASSGVSDGVVYVTTMHTTTGITVNECLKDVEDDLVSMLRRLAVDGEQSYTHARFLRSDGAMAVNSHSHQRAALLGPQVAFPVEGGKAVLGGRQTIYFAEMDGPLRRNYVIHVIGNDQGDQHVEH